MIHPVQPKALLKFIKAGARKLTEHESTEEGEEEASLLDYDEMNSSQKDLVDRIIDEQSNFTFHLAIRAVNELDFDTNLGKLYFKEHIDTLQYCSFTQNIVG